MQSTFSASRVAFFEARLAFAVGSSTSGPATEFARISLYRSIDSVAAVSRARIARTLSATLPGLLPVSASTWGPVHACTSDRTPPVAPAPRTLSGHVPRIIGYT